MIPDGVGFATPWFPPMPVSELKSKPPNCPPAPGIPPDIPPGIPPGINPEP